MLVARCLQEEAARSIPVGARPRVRFSRPASRTDEVTNEAPADSLAVLPFANAGGADGGQPEATASLESLINTFSQIGPTSRRSAQRGIPLQGRRSIRQ